MTGPAEDTAATAYVKAAFAERGRVAAELSGPGWVLTTAAAMGMAPPEQIMDAFAPALRLDPRGRGKLHARDVVCYDRDTGMITEAGSIAHVDGTGDFSRFRLTQAPQQVRGIAADLLTLIPAPLRHRAGRLSADYFRYVPGTRSDAHQDGFGDVVFIWVLARDGTGGDSYLTALHGRRRGRDVFRGVVEPGQLLIFRDDLFLHGLTTMHGWRDALIFITLKDDA